MDTEKKSEGGAGIDNLTTAFGAFVGAGTWLLRAHRAQLTPERLHELEAFQAQGRRLAIHITKEGYRPIVSVALADADGGLIVFDRLELIGGKIIIT